jgi:hypothetical protein
MGTMDGHVHSRTRCTCAAKPGCAAIPRGPKFRSASIAWRACWSRSWRLINGRVVAFEPDGESFTQYFFWARRILRPPACVPEVAAAIEKRAEKLQGECSDCGEPATWLWISRREVSSLDQTERIENSPGALFCAKHGAAKLCDALGQSDEANLFYVNAPYGDSGAYVWI